MFALGAVPAWGVVAEIIGRLGGGGLLIGDLVGGCVLGVNPKAVAVGGSRHGKTLKKYC